MTLVELPAVLGEGLREKLVASRRDYSSPLSTRSFPFVHLAVRSNLFQKQ